MLNYDPSRNHTAKSLIFHYLLILVIRTFGWLSWNTFQKGSKTPEQYQHDLLTGILKLNSGTEYGKKYHFKKMQNREDFKKNHPLTDYKHYRLDLWMIKI